MEPRNAGETSPPNPLSDFGEGGPDRPHSAKSWNRRRAGEPYPRPRQTASAEQTSPPNPLSDFGEGEPDMPGFDPIEPSRGWQTRAGTWVRLRPSVKELRAEATPAERLLWSALRNRQLNGARWRRQHAIDGFVVDFYCTQARLVVEVDGDIHDSQAEEDRQRQRVLERRGLTVLRFRNDAVQADLPSVLARLLEVLGSPSPKSERGLGGEV